MRCLCGQLRPRNATARCKCGHLAAEHDYPPPLSLTSVSFTNTKECYAEIPDDPRDDPLEVAHA